MCTRNELNLILQAMTQAYQAVYGANVVKIILYGSYARGDYQKDSDIDIVAIVQGDREKLQQGLKSVWDISSDLELEYGTIVSPTVIPFAEYEKYKNDLPYYRNIESEGVEIVADNREELKVYRLEMAKERLHSSKILLEAGSYKDSIGRSYYAMFTAVRALLAVEGQDFSKHAGVIAYFQKEYVKTGKFDKKYSKYISQAFQIRNNTDYADFFLVSLQDAKEQYDRAEEFVKVIEEFLKME